MAFSTVRGVRRASGMAAAMAAAFLLAAYGTDAANVGGEASNTTAPALQLAALALVSSGGYPVSIGVGRALPVTALPPAPPPRDMVSAAGNTP